MTGLWEERNTQVAGCWSLKWGFFMSFIAQKLQEHPEEQLWAAKQDKSPCPEMWHLS